LTFVCRAAWILGRGIRHFFNDCEEIMKTGFWIFLACGLLPGVVRASDPAKPRMIEKEVVLPASRAEVWHLWTTNEGIQKSVGVKGSDIELKRGGKFEIYFGMEMPPGRRGSEGCKILAFDPLEMLAFEWNAPPSIPELRDTGAKTQVVLRFADAGAGKTKVQFTQLGMGRGDAWDRYYAYFEKAWPNVFAHMEAYLNQTERATQNAAAPSDLNGLRHERLINAPAGEVWRAFTTGEGLKSWMATAADVDLRPGGKMRASYKKDAQLGDESTIENTFLVVVPERLMAVRCTKPPANFPFKTAFDQVWTVIYFDPVGEKQTRVRCHSLNYGTDEEAKKCREHFDKGNDWTIGKLKQYAEKK
jgi:uncharacterized protein YndB with AHSA1/START domain